MKYIKYNKTKMVDKVPVSIPNVKTRYGFECRATCQSCKFGHRNNPDVKAYNCENDVLLTPHSNYETCDRWEPRDCFLKIGTTKPGLVKSPGYIRFLVENVTEIRQKHSELMEKAKKAGHSLVSVMEIDSLYEYMRSQYMAKTGKTIYD